MLSCATRAAWWQNASCAEPSNTPCSMHALRFGTLHGVAWMLKFPQSASSLCIICSSPKLQIVHLQGSEASASMMRPAHPHVGQTTFGVPEDFPIYSASRPKLH